MKRLIKLFPVALGLLALASCSNDEFAGGEYAQVGRQQLIANLEAPNEAGTRAAFVPGTMSALWQKGDQFRVYDANLQKYDIYECDGSAIALKGSSAKVEAHAKALFPGNQVFYAGYDDANDDIIAVMNIKNSWAYEGQDVIGGTTGYVGALPMWGDVKTESAEKLEVDLKYLTAYTDITVYGNFTNKIRVIAAAADVTEDVIKTTEVAALTAAQVDATTPLSGYFEAQLKDGGVLKKTDNAMVAATNSVKPYIEVTGLGAADESHVYIPIIPATYKNLMIQYWDGAKWVTLKAYKNTTIARNTPIRKDLVLGTKPTTAVVSSLKDLNDKIKLAAVTDGAVLKVSIKEGSELATTETLQDLDLNNKTLSLTIDGTIKNSTPNLPLTIKNVGDGSVINVKIEGTEAVVLENANAMTLVGSATSTGTAAHKLLTVNGAGAVTLGNGNAGPFSTDMNVVVKGAALTVDAYSGTIAAIDNDAAATDKAINITSGTVTAIGGNTPAAGIVTVNGGTVTDITTKTGAVNVGAKAAVTNVTTETGAPSISSALTSLTTKAATATIAASVTTASFGANATVITLTGTTKAADAVVKIGTLKGTKADAAQTITVNSTDKAAIGTVTFAKAGSTLTSSSSLSAGATVANIKTTEINTNGEIYTAAQLAGVTTGKAYKLMGTINLNNIAAWTPVNISQDFDGNKQIIQNVNGASLFGTISGGTVKDLTISTVNNDADVKPIKGGLAAQATGTVTVQNVAITDATIGKNAEAAPTTADFGGLFGKTNGTITLLDNKVTATINGYANMGGYIGNVAGGTVNILTTKADDTYKSVITFAQKSGAASGLLFGTVGNFIGSITGTDVTVKVGKSGTTANAGAAIANFMDITTAGKGVTADNKEALGYFKNKIENNTKKFNGMQGNVTDVTGLTLKYEVGYSTGTINSLTLYDKTEDDLGNPFTLTKDNINQYVAVP